MAAHPKEDRLRSLNLFKKADDKAIDHLASAADEVTVPAGKVLIQQDHNHNEIYVLMSGAASVVVEGEEVAEIPTGELVGELGFFVQGPASATVTTTAESDLLIIPYNRFDQILGDNPDLVRSIAEELAERLYAMDEKIS
ncbi:MAG: cyclic nucleotide-binding domain-containing protein [Acidimicrobiia bacterium]|nr:cyclic nucleotide-binding domain-containing protein [Acidimicrobiia bacterium]